MESSNELFPDVLPPSGSEIVTVKAMNSSLATMQEAVQEFDKIASSLATVELQHPKALKLDLKVPENMLIAKAGYGAWRAQRIAVEKARKGAKRPLIDLGKAVDGFAARLEESTSAGEKNYLTQIEARNAEIEREEQARKDRHLAGIATIKGFVQRAKGLPHPRIQLGIDRLKAMKFEADWEEYANQAYLAQQETLKELEAMLAAAKAEEALAEQRRQEEEERKRVQAEMDAEQDRLEKERASLDAKAAAMAKHETAVGDMQMMTRHVEAARESDSLKDVQQHIDSLAQWPVTEPLFGTMVPVVQMAKDAALLQVREAYRLLDLMVHEQERQRLIVEAKFEAENKVAVEVAVLGAPPPAPAPSPEPADEVDPFGPVVVPPPAPEPLSASMRAPADLPPAQEREVVFVSPAYEQAVAQRQPIEEATLNIGQMVGLLRFQITAEFVADDLEMPPRVVERRAKLYYPSDFPLVCDALIEHIETVRDAYIAGIGK